MATVTIPDNNQVISGFDQVRDCLASVGIEYERWEAGIDVSSDAPGDQILDAYSAEIDRLKKEGGYATADVIDVRPDTPGLETMLSKFNREHWHDEDEVRFIIQGRGLFHVRPPGGPVLAIEVEEGDLIRVPRGTLHWFNLCSDRRIRAIRLFQDPAGWAPHYTDSQVDARYEPVCLGPQYIPAAQPSR
jgi:1,2-dihydroxy-3-keto-5-methylthiopentene dioxygenase